MVYEYTSPPDSNDTRSRKGSMGNDPTHTRRQDDGRYTVVVKKAARRCDIGMRIANARHHYPAITIQWPSTNKNNVCVDKGSRV